MVRNQTGARFRVPQRNRPPRPAYPLAGALAGCEGHGGSIPAADLYGGAPTRIEGARRSEPRRSEEGR
jgi:hypothetical protein